MFLTLEAPLLLFEYLLFHFILKLCFLLFRDEHSAGMNSDEQDPMMDNPDTDGTDETAKNEVSSSSKDFGTTTHPGELGSRVRYFFSHIIDCSPSLLHLDMLDSYLSLCSCSLQEHVGYA